jgi:predicted  nucleic acid-binding Zn-ribbon protein
MELPPNVQVQRAVEDRAIKLGNERTQLEGRLGEITEEAVDLMGEAERSSVSIERLAELIQVARPTLYRWRDSISILRADRAEQAGGA